MDHSRNNMGLPTFQVESPSPKQILGISEQLAQIGEYLLAIVSLYRVLGITSEQFLQIYGQFTDWNSGIYHGIKEEFLQIRNEIHPNRNQLPSSLGFSDFLFIIHIMNQDLISFSSLKRLILLSDNRHQSWLAHGTFTPGQKEYSSMKNAYLPVIHSLMNQVQKGCQI